MRHHSDLDKPSRMYCVLQQLGKLQIILAQI